MSATNASKPGAICFVANDFDGIVRNGGIGTYFYLNAVLLARAGWKVHVLYTSPIEDADAGVAVPRKLKQLGVEFHYLERLPDPASEDGHPSRSPWFMERSDRVRNVLKHLHAEHKFDFIEFAEWQGMGFRTVQAKRQGSDFHDTAIIVRPHSCSQWVREGNLEWTAWHEDARLDFCERYAFDNADVQLSPSAYMLDYLREIGWNARPDAAVSFYPFPEPTRPATAKVTKDGPTEIVFFGRLEIRKGLEIFLDALKGIDPSVPVTFLGKNTRLADGAQAVDVIRARTSGRATVKVIIDANREQALEYVTSGNKITVMASLADNLPFTVIESIVNRVPFVASAVGGIPEMVTDADARKSLLFEPNAKSLQRCLTEYLKLTQAERDALHAKVSDSPMVSGNRDQVLTTYTGLLAAARRKSRVPAPTATPLVSIVVPYYNLPEFLPETLASLAAQTYPNLDVIVVNDGSTDPAAVRVFEQMTRQYPRFRFVSQVNSGIGAARNRGLTEARGEFFIPVDADNIAHPKMVERFVAAMHHRPDAAVLTCYFQAFRETSDIAAGKFRYFYRPSGGPHFLGSIVNVFGDANAIIRTAALRSVGGFETDRTTSWEDWECFVKLVNAGYVLDVIPEFLLYYRHRDESWMRATSEWKNHRRVLRQYFKTGPKSPAETMSMWLLMVSLAKRVMHLDKMLSEVGEQLRQSQTNEEWYRHAAHQLRLDAEQVRKSKGYKLANRANQVAGRLRRVMATIKSPMALLRKRPVLQLIGRPQVVPE